MLFLLTGGSANGKSFYAEQLVLRYPTPRVYVATMQPYGEEGQARVARHRKMRAAKQFTTIEAQTDVGDIVPPAGSTVLLECICNLVNNEMFDDQGTMTPLPQVIDKVVAAVDTLATRCDNLVVVTNDVGSELLEGYSDNTRAYVQAIGDINRQLSQRADNVYELVCGIPLLLKGELL